MLSIAFDALLDASATRLVGYEISVLYGWRGRATVATASPLGLPASVQENRPAIVMSSGMRG